MVPTQCGPLGLVGWPLTILLWVGLLAGVVWAIARLFPTSSEWPAPPPSGRSAGHRPDPERIGDP